MVTESRGKCCLRAAAVSLVAVLIAAVAGEVGSLRSLDDRTHHLGTPGEPEWQEFVGRSPDGRSLELHFTGQTAAHECTLFLRQRDVKLQWIVQLNGRKIG